MHNNLIKLINDYADTHIIQNIQFVCHHCSMSPYTCTNSDSHAMSYHTNVLSCQSCDCDYPQPCHHEGTLLQASNIPEVEEWTVGMWHLPSKTAHTKNVQTLEDGRSHHRCWLWQWPSQTGDWVSGHTQWEAGSQLLPPHSQRPWLHKGSRCWWHHHVSWAGGILHATPATAPYIASEEERSLLMILPPNVWLYSSSEGGHSCQVLFDVHTYIAYYTEAHAQEWSSETVIVCGMTQSWQKACMHKWTQ